MAKKRNWPDVLKWNYLAWFTKDRDALVAEAYREYRQEQGLPNRCDIDGCPYHSPANQDWFVNGTPQWRKEPLEFGVDHISGNAYDSRPENLRLVCANCATQLPTHAGRNRGRILSAGESWFSLRGLIKGTRSHTFFASGGAKMGGSAAVKFTPNKPPDEDT